MCHEAANLCLAALKFIPDWFVTSKILQKFDNALHANDDILFHNEDFDKVTFITNLDNNFDEDDLDIIFHTNFWLGVINLKNRKHLKKEKQRINANSVES